ncbi:protein YgfX [Halomonas denitrificans]|nr:hypothetical protein [Halomonas denitrificans]
MPRLRRLLVGLATLLALVAVVRSSLAAWMALPSGLVVLALGARALYGGSKRLRIRYPQPGLVVVDTEARTGRWQGRFEPLYTSGFYCAFRVTDPARGSRVFGLFRDELDPDAWRRLQVVLRGA